MCRSRMGFPYVIIIRVMGAYARLVALEAFGRHYAKRLQCAGKNQSSHAIRKLALLKQFELRVLIFTTVQGISTDRSENAS